ncbi:MAG: MFS transporter [Firmicutes bacterium]|nr:MFS transporter [Bacillota bacterium]
MNSNTRRLVALIQCCICIGCSTGLINNCLGLFYTPIANDLAIGRGDIALMSTLMSLSSAFFIQIAARLIRKLPISAITSFGASVSALSCLILSFADKLPVFYFCGVLFGLGASFFSALPVSITLRSWYGEKNASKLGLAMAFSGLVAAVMNPILGKIISGGGYQSGFRIMAIIIVMVALPCTLTMKLGDESTEKASTKSGSGTTDTVIAASTMLLMMLTCATIPIQTGMNSHFSAYSVSLGYTLAFGATVVSFQSIFNSAWKLVFGFIADHLGVIKASILYASMTITGCILLLMFTGIPAAIIIGVSLFATVFSISTVGVPALLQRVAKERYAEVYAKTTIIQTVGYALFTWLYGSISDKAGNYLPCLIIVIAASVCCALLFAVLGRRIQKDQ